MLIDALVHIVCVCVCVCSGSGKGLTLEEQKSKLAAARAKVRGDLAGGPTGDPTSGVGSSLYGKGVRGVHLGSDRDGACFWKLQAADAFGGEPQDDLLTVTQWCTGNIGLCTSAALAHFSSVHKRATEMQETKMHSARSPYPLQQCTVSL